MLSSRLAMLCILGAYGLPAVADTEYHHHTLASGWEEYEPGGETSCARGGPFSFFVYPGDPERVLFDFMGGGSCADGASCDYLSPRFIDTVDAVRLGITYGLPGINEIGNPANPYKGWTRVFIPYCTGDVHWGHTDKTYKSPNGYTYEIKHRGSQNVQSVVNWTKEHLGGAKRVFVSGCSAGGYGSIYYTPLIQETFPNADVDQFADSAVAVAAPGKPGLNIYGWNIEASAPAWIPELDPKLVDYSKLVMPDLYMRMAKHYPNIHFSEFSNTFDAVQIQFFPSSKKEQWRPLMLQSLQTITDAVPNFSSFVADGIGHCSTWNYDFYWTQTQGVNLRDWLSDEASHRVFRNVSCVAEGCLRP